MKPLTTEEKEIATHLKASIWYTTTNQVSHQTQLLSQDTNQPITATPRFTAALVELINRQLSTIGEDLESFAKHAGRKLITPDDFKMCVRKNDTLKEICEEYLGSVEQAEKNAKVEKNTKEDNEVDEDVDSSDEFSDLGIDVR